MNKILKVDHIEWVKLLNPKSIKYPLMISGVPSLKLKELLKMGFRLNQMKLYGKSPDDSYGPAALRQALGRYYNVKPSNIAMCAGANMAIYLVCAALLQNRDDEVIIEEPCYEPFRRSAQSLTDRIRYLPRRIANCWQPDPDELDKLITPRTRFVLLSDLHNPSGVRLQPETIKGLVRVAERRGILIAVDEVYKDFLFSERGEPLCNQSPRLISFSSLTKVYGLGYMRTGWVMSTPKLTYMFSRTYDYMSANDAYPAQMISLHCLRHINKLVTRTGKRVGNGRQIIKEWIESEPKLEWVEPDGGIICFIKLPHGINSRKFCAHLLRRYKTAVVPGDYFGSPGYIRVAGGVKPKLIKQGLKNISAALRKFGC
ncbi:MAG: pyridoxal phosphate-dependent aminotransferase [Planctomycetes bacterium]|nr:pyridoxal phosphate-dependent aminotransferase [Planctomycetota bacterium]